MLQEWTESQSQARKAQDAFEDAEEIRDSQKITS